MIFLGRLKYRTFGSVRAGSYESSRSCPDSSWRSEPPNCTAKTKTVAETVRGAGEFFQFCAVIGIQQIELFAAMSQPAEADPEEPDLSFLVPMSSKEFLKHGKNVGIETRRFSQCFGACVRIKAGVANRQREGARGEAGFAQALRGFLRKMAEHGRESVRIVCVLAKSMIVRDRFWLGIDDKFVRIAAARFAVKIGRAHV